MTAEIVPFADLSCCQYCDATRQRIAQMAELTDRTMREKSQAERRIEELEMQLRAERTIRELEAQLVAAGQKMPVQSETTTEGERILIIAA